MKNTHWKIQLLSLFIGGIIYLFFIHDNVAAYINWKTLTKREVIRAAETFIEQRNIKESVCLYVVECIDDKAHLRMIKDIDVWDIEATKQTIWKRKFDGTCTGRTANIAIDYATDNHQRFFSGESDNSGIWSFSTNGFYSRRSRFYGGSFSEYPFELCTDERYVIKFKN